MFFRKVERSCWCVTKSKCDYKHPRAQASVKVSPSPAKVPGDSALPPLRLHTGEYLGEGQEVSEAMR